ncbi:sensor histidine kinase [Desulforegula conservatrix]|uniref:sensor histidine kinase n=1 Tax=Desulforegula conservatrix TaxID=153026 RepID=UPI0004295D5F|nr:HAMP domain-containing sensor histidine kinase [Desulforegula conservatrix]
MNKYMSNLWSRSDLLAKTPWFFHPVTILAISIGLIAMFLFLSLYWFLKVTTDLENLILKFNIEAGQFLISRTWLVVVVLSVLVALTSAGIFIIFLYLLKTIQLYRLQHNFINNFTHELKTPVTSLKLYLETFLKYDLSKEDQHKYIRYMIQDVGRLSDNISRILNLARIESKHYAGEFAPKNVYEFIRNLVDENRHVFVDADVKVLPPKHGSIVCQVNDVLFEMLIMNIITNGIKYNNSDKPAIRVSFKRISQRVEIYFQDNGIGIRKNQLNKIFKKFYQIGISDNMTAKGSGLGLYIVNNIARIHSGKIIAHSRGAWKGSIFTLVLPVSDDSGSS